MQCDDKEDKMLAWAKAMKTDILAGLGTVIDKKISRISKEIHTLRECVGICSGKADAALRKRRQRNMQRSPSIPTSTAE